MSVKVIGKQSGIEYKGVQDLSEPDPRPQLLNALILGQFRRGRLDQMMRITSANIRQQLGYDPKNSDYVAVADALQNGAPYVWVQRILSAQCDPTEVMLVPRPIEYAGNALINFWYEFEVIENGVKKSGVDSFYEQTNASGIPSSYQEILTKILSNLGYIVPTEHYAFSVDFSIKGATGSKIKMPIDLTIKQTEIPNNLDGINVSLFDLMSVIDGVETTAKEFTVHSCGFDSY